MKMGKPDIVHYAGGVPVKLNYPRGATGKELWKIYSTKAKFLKSGHPWNSDEGRALGNAHIRAVQEAEWGIESRAKVGAKVQQPAKPAKEDVIKQIDGAIEFHLTRTKMHSKVRMWREIKEAIIAGYASNNLKYSVQRSVMNARKRGRFYDLWKSVDKWIRQL